MVELRKRPAPKETATPAPSAKRGSGSNSTSTSAAGKVMTAATKIKDTVLGAGSEPEAETATANGTSKRLAGTVGEKVELEGFGGEVQTHEGATVTLKELVDKSGAGIVVFTYPKASTPGCTTQACLFRDSYSPITGASLAVYGLSTDSPKSNTTFVTKQSLPYPLLCDPNATLTTAIGMKKPGPGKSTSRGVVVIDKQGTVKVWTQAGPQKTLDAVLDYIKGAGMTETGAPAAVAGGMPAADPVASEQAAKPADPYQETAPVSAPAPTAAPSTTLAPPTNGVADVKMDEPPLITTPSKDEEEAAETAAEVGETAAKLDSNEAGMI